MNDEEFKEVIDDLECNRLPVTGARLRARDTAQREALARVEAERDALELLYQAAKSSRATLTNLCKSAIEDRDSVQAQLAEAVGLVEKSADLAGELGDYFVSLAKRHSGTELLDHERNLRDFLSRQAPAEQQDAQGAQAGEFQREDRYIVIKRKDLDAAPLADRERFNSALLMLTLNLRMRECLVIESDWPEYEPTWAAIQSRVEGRAARAAQPAAGEPVAWQQRARLRVEQEARENGRYDFEVAPPAAAHGDEAVHLPPALAARVIVALVSTGLNADYRMAESIRELVDMRAQGDGVKHEQAQHLGDAPQTVRSAPWATEG